MAGDAVIAAGFGFRLGATVDSLTDALDRAGGTTGVAVLATASDKAAAPVFQDFAKRLGLPVRGIDAGGIAAQPTATRSAASLAARATGSLAEAAALAAQGPGPGARLVAPRCISGDGMATCALAIRGTG